MSDTKEWAEKLIAAAWHGPQSRVEALVRAIARAAAEEAAKVCDKMADEEGMRLNIYVCNRLHVAADEIRAELASEGRRAMSERCNAPYACRDGIAFCEGELGHDGRHNYGLGTWADDSNCGTCCRSKARLNTCPGYEECTGSKDALAPVAGSHSQYQPVTPEQYVKGYGR